MFERKTTMNKYEAFVGKVLDGRYKILELVGMGGMACVLKAQDLVMNRIVRAYQTRHPRSLVQITFVLRELELT